MRDSVHRAGDRCVWAMARIEARKLIFSVVTPVRKQPVHCKHYLHIFTIFFPLVVGYCKFKSAI